MAAPVAQQSMLFGSEACIPIWRSLILAFPHRKHAAQAKRFKDQAMVVRTVLLTTDPWVQFYTKPVASEDSEPMMAQGSDPVLHPDLEYDRWGSLCDPYPLLNSFAQSDDDIYDEYPDVIRLALEGGENADPQSWPRKWFGRVINEWGESD
jgi:hypothetical protein